MLFLGICCGFCLVDSFGDGFEESWIDKYRSSSIDRLFVEETDFTVKSDMYPTDEV